MLVAREGTVGANKFVEEDVEGKKSVLCNQVSIKTSISRFSLDALSWLCGNRILLIHVSIGPPKRGFSLLHG